MEKAEVSMTFLCQNSLASVLATPAQPQKTKAGTGNMKNCPLQKITFKSIQRRVYKSMGSDGMQPQLWQYSEVLTNWKRVNMTPIFKRGKKKDSGNYSPVSLSFVPSRITEQKLC